MARARRPESPQTVQLTVDAMRAAIPKLDRRINDLESFDVTTIRKRWDPVMEALEKKVNGTLQEVLGHGTVEYNEYSIRSLDTLPVILGGGTYPLPSVMQGYQAGIERAVLKLKTLKELFEERVLDAQADGAQNSVPPTFTQAAPTRRIFVVHGWDDGTKETVARFVSRLRLEPVITS